MTPERSAHPVLFLILFLPMGISNGYVVVTLGYLLTHAGVSVDDVAWLVGVSLFPQVWKFLWAPIVDTTLSNKSWFVISATLTGLLMAGTTIIAPTHSNFILIAVLVFGFNVTSSFNAMAADALMAHATTPDQKGRASTMTVGMRMPPRMVWTARSCSRTGSVIHSSQVTGRIFCWPSMSKAVAAPVAS